MEARWLTDSADALGKDPILKLASWVRAQGVGEYLKRLDELVSTYENETVASMSELMVRLTELAEHKRQV